MTNRELVEAERLLHGGIRWLQERRVIGGLRPVVERVHVAQVGRRVGGGRDIRVVGRRATMLILLESFAVPSTVGTDRPCCGRIK